MQCLLNALQRDAVDDAVTARRSSGRMGRTRGKSEDVEVTGVESLIYQQRYHMANKLDIQHPASQIMIFVLI